MSTYLKKYIWAPVLLGLFICSPFSVYAASSILVQAPSSTVSEGDTVLIPINARIEEEAGINALGASVHIEGPAVIESVETGGSVFTLWPQIDTPGGKDLAFVGGSVSGVAGTRLHIITLAIKILGSGSITIGIDHATAYGADGNGTPRTLASQSVSLRSKSVSPGTPQQNALAESLSQDTTPPDPFSIEIARDESVFGGAYFLTFHTTDIGTGVARYTVIEGSRAPVVSSGVYEIQDQSLKTPIEVRAYDAAGNVRIARFTPQGSVAPSRSVAILVVILIGSGVLYFILKRRKNL